MLKKNLAVEDIDEKGSKRGDALAAARLYFQAELSISSTLL
jgi:hypothetical protein